jgi:hypothetical protein
VEPTICLTLPCARWPAHPCAPGEMRVSAASSAKHTQQQKRQQQPARKHLVNVNAGAKLDSSGLSGCRGCHMRHVGAPRAQHCFNQ